MERIETTFATHSERSPPFLALQECYCGYHQVAAPVPEPENLKWRHSSSANFYCHSLYCDRCLIGKLSGTLSDKLSEKLNGKLQAVQIGIHALLTQEFSMGT